MPAAPLAVAARGGPRPGPRPGTHPQLRVVLHAARAARLRLSAQPAEVPVQVAGGAVRACAAARQRTGRADGRGPGAPADGPGPRAPLREPDVARVQVAGARRGAARHVAIPEPLAGEAVRPAQPIALSRGAGHVPRPARAAHLHPRHHR